MNKLNKGLKLVIQGLKEEGSYLEIESFIEAYQGGLNFIIDNNKGLKEEYNLLVEYTYNSFNIFSRSSQVINYIIEKLEEEEDRKEEYIREELDNIYNCNTVLGVDAREIEEELRSVLL